MQQEINMINKLKTKLKNNLELIAILSIPAGALLASAIHIFGA